MSVLVNQTSEIITLFEIVDINTHTYICISIYLTEEKKATTLFCICISDV